MTCNCSPIIIATVADKVQASLDKVNAVKQLTTDHNRLVGDISGTILDDLSALVNIIPTVPVLDLTTLLGFITCPLTPLALGIDLTTLSGLDPRSIALLMKRQLRCQSSSVQGNYDIALTQLKSQEVVRQLRRYVTEVYRALGDVTAFTAEFPINVAHCLVIKEVCPDTFSDATYPFSQFITAISDWSFDGILPSGIDERAIPFIKPIAQAEVKLFGWKALATISV